MILFNNNKTKIFSDEMFNVFNIIIPNNIKDIINNINCNIIDKKLVIKHNNNFYEYELFSNNDDEETNTFIQESIILNNKIAELNNEIKELKIINKNLENILNENLVTKEKLNDLYKNYESKLDNIKEKYCSFDIDVLINNKTQIEKIIYDSKIEYLFSFNIYKNNRETNFSINCIR